MDSHCLFFNVPIEGEGKLCYSHQRASGLLAATPMLREPDPCAKCGHPELVRSRTVRGRGCHGGDVGMSYVAPLGMSFALREFIVDVDQGFLQKSIKEKRQ